MLHDDLLDQLKNMINDITTVKAYWQNSNSEQEYEKLKQISAQEDFWKNENQTSVLKQLQHIEQKRDLYRSITQNYDDFLDILELFKDDEAELERIAPDITQLKKDLKALKVSFLLQDPDDNSPCFLTINSGAGGTESQDWANALLRMYLRFCEREKLQAKIVDYQAGEEAGIKSATLYIKGKYPYGILKSEVGIHRLVRISPFDSNQRRHTSFAAISLSPEVPEIKITIDPKDLRIDTYRASGAGGQHVNKTDSAVRITHIPSNIVVQCQNERSQLQNKETAMKMLQARLYQKEKAEQAALAASKEKKQIGWGSQIRSYVLHPYKMVKDHRTSIESPQPELVLDGELMQFIEAFLIGETKD